MEVKGKKLESENVSVLFCESCEVENLRTSANGVCQECKEYMCGRCFRHHLKSKRTKSHVLLSLEEFSSLTLDCGLEDVIKCRKHENEIIKFYCRSHDFIGCGDCIVLEHTSCKPEYINDLAKTFSDGDVYKSIIKRVEDLRKKTSDYEREIEKSQEVIGKMNEKVLKEIREFRKEINTCLDKAEAKILSEMKKMGKENTGQLEKIEKGLQSLTSELQMVAQLLNTQLHHGNALFINAVNCKSKLTDLETMYENTTKEKALKEFNFVRNRQMAELLKAVEPLGSLMESWMYILQQQLGPGMYNMEQSQQIQVYPQSNVYQGMYGNQMGLMGNTHGQMGALAQGQTGMQQGMIGMTGAYAEIKSYHKQPYTPQAFSQQQFGNKKVVPPPQIQPLPIGTKSRSAWQ